MKVPIFDTHQHLVYSDKWPYSWTDELPQLVGECFHYEDYLKLIQGTGIVGSIFMETSPDDPHWNEETRFVDQLSREPGSLIRGVIANCRPEEKSGFQAYIESIHNDRLVGLRRFLHAVPDEVSEPACFAENLRLLSGYDLTFDLCVLARQIPIAHRLARLCPDVRFVLDHCGFPDIASGSLDPWRKHIRELAELPNVNCKMSGLMAYCKPGEANLESVKPFFEHSIESFGWDRVLWGSDWPVVNLTSSLPEWVTISRELVKSESEENQRKLFHQNAERIYQVNM